MKTRRFWLTFDLVIQAGLLSLLLSALVMGVWEGVGTGIIMALISLFLIGVWQMLSVLVKTLLIRRRWHGLYLLSASAFLVLGGFWLSVQGKFPELFPWLPEYVPVLLFLPTLVVAAFTYAGLSWRELRDYRDVMSPFV